MPRFTDERGVAWMVVVGQPRDAPPSSAERAMPEGLARWLETTFVFLSAHGERRLLRTRDIQRKAGAPHRPARRPHMSIRLSDSLRMREGTDAGWRQLLAMAEPWPPPAPG